MSAFAKALVPAVTTLVAVILQWAVSGTLDQPELLTAIVGVVTSVLTYLVPNTPQEAP